MDPIGGAGDVPAANNLPAGRSRPRDRDAAGLLPGAGRAAARRPARGALLTSRGGRHHAAGEGKQRGGGTDRSSFGTMILIFASIKACSAHSGGRSLRAVSSSVSTGPSGMDGLFRALVRPDLGRTETMTTTIAHRRSAELEELIDRDAATFRILTGDRPTGRPAPGPLLRHPAEPGQAAGPRRGGLRADRRLPGADRPGRGRAPG